MLVSGTLPVGLGSHCADARSGAQLPPEPPEVPEDPVATPVAGTLSPGLAGLLGVEEPTSVPGVPFEVLGRAPSPGDSGPTAFPPHATATQTATNSAKKSSFRFQRMLIGMPRRGISAGSMPPRKAIHDRGSASGQARLSRQRTVASRLGLYRITPSPAPGSGPLMSFKSTCFDTPANNVGPQPATLARSTDSYALT